MRIHIHSPDSRSVADPTHFRRRRPNLTMNILLCLVLVQLQPSCGSMHEVWGTLTDGRHAASA